MSELISTPLDKYKLAYEVASSEITLLLEVETTGWIGIGVSAGAGMRGADIATIEADGDSHVIKDRHALDKQLPIEDCSSDWFLLEHSIVNGKTLAKIKRKLDTGDDQDRPILDNKSPTPILVAHGEDSQKTIVYHSMNRATLGMSFFGQLPTVDSLYENADVRQLSLRMHHCDDPQAPYIVPTPGNMDDVTTLVNQCFDLPDELKNKEAHLVGFEQYLTPGNEALVHHFVLYGSDASCSELGGLITQNTDTTQATQLWAWQSGTGNFIFPASMGFPIGKGTRIKSLFNNVHYDNPTMKRYQEDASGITVHYTMKLRKYEMAVISVGDPRVLLAGRPVMIPGTTAPKALHGFECPASHFEKWDLGGSKRLEIVSSLQHMHRAGDYMRTDVVDGDGIVKTRWSRDLYDGNFASPNSFDSPYIKYEKGDRIKVSCVYAERLKNPKDDVLNFGLQGDDEMCMDFLYVYSPDMNLAEISPELQFCGLRVTSGARAWKKPIWDSVRNFNIKFAGPMNLACESTISNASTPTYRIYTVGGTQMSVGQLGPDDAEHTVVALHGFPQGSAMWFPEFAPTLLQALDGKVRIIAPDMRSVNRTMPKYECVEEGCANYRPQAIADEVALLLKTHFNATTRKLHIVGHDWGAVIAWYVTIYHKELVETLTVASVAHPSVFAQLINHHEGQMYATMSYVPDMVRADDTFPTLKPVKGKPLEPMLASVMEHADDQEADYRDAWTNSDSLKHFMYWYRGAEGFKAFEEVVANDSVIGPEIAVLQVWGSKDTAVLPQAICCLKSVVTKLHVEVLKDATHWVVDERGHEIAEFVAKQVKGAYAGEENEKCSQVERICSKELEAICRKNGTLPSTNCDTSKYPDKAWDLACDVVEKGGVKAPFAGEFWSEDGELEAIKVEEGDIAPKKGMLCPYLTDKASGGCDICGDGQLKRDATFLDDQSKEQSCALAQAHFLGNDCGDISDTQAYFRGPCCEGSSGCDICGGGQVKRNATFLDDQSKEQTCAIVQAYCLGNDCGDCGTLQASLAGQCCEWSGGCDICGDGQLKRDATYLDEESKEQSCASIQAYCLGNDCGDCGTFQAYLAGQCCEARNSNNSRRMSSDICVERPEKSASKGNVTFEVLLPGTPSDYESVDAKRALIESFMAILPIKDVKPSWVSVSFEAQGSGARRLSNVAVTYTVTIPADAAIDEKDMSGAVAAINPARMASTFKRALKSAAVPGAASIPAEIAPIIASASSSSSSSYSSSSASSSSASSSSASSLSSSLSSTSEPTVSFALSPWSLTSPTRSWGAGAAFVMQVFVR
eukprot:TRINITY_DN16530_c0_g1_i4.p1 TRINITY_DN16530_c0_g1~~TRINITY_DN16530_c0_g1_i4.p1  ORF type:complete len:1367 (+),score=229.35 TRINITY_DN16530_c0_g1_i4:191-4102(+)